MEGHTPAVSVVIPVYNEPENIRLTLEALRGKLPDPHEILVVYDTDDDTTLTVLNELAPTYPELRVVKNDVARGPSGALRTGIRQSRGSTVIVTMADLSDDLDALPHLLAIIPGEADIVCPSRYCSGGRQELEPSLKVWAPRFAGRVMHWLCGLGTVDPTNSHKLYRGDLVRSLPLRSTVSFSVTLEIVAKAHCLGCCIVEVPTVWRNRQHGTTNFRLGRSLVVYTPWLLLALLNGRFFRIPLSWRRCLILGRTTPSDVRSTAERPELS